MSSKLEGHKIIIVFAVAGIVIAMAIVILSRNCYTVKTQEGFQSPALTSCPEGSKSFYDNRSNLMCCNGQVNGNYCEGTIVCSFSNNSQKYPSCKVIVEEQINRRAAATAAAQSDSVNDDCLARCRQARQ